jgi:lipoprotein signal peptidase
MEAKLKKDQARQLQFKIIWEIILILMSTKNKGYSTSMLKQHDQEMMILYCRTSLICLYLTLCNNITPRAMRRVTIQAKVSEERQVF